MSLKADTKYKGLSSEQIKQIEKPSWGASLNWIYLLAMHAYWQAIVYVIVLFIPIFNFVAWIIVIFIGKKLAWENRYWTSFDEYTKVQKAWDKGAKIYYGILLGITVISLIIVGGSVLLNSPSMPISQSEGLNRPIYVDQLTVSAKDFRKVEDKETTKYEAETGCGRIYTSNDVYCKKIDDGYPIYSITLNFKNTGSKDYSLNKEWISIIEDASATTTLIPIRYKLYFKDLNGHDIDEEFIIPSSGEKDVALPFKLQNDRTEITLLLKLYTNAQGKIILSLPK